jgi:hypothetical protein
MMFWQSISILLWSDANGLTDGPASIQAFHTVIENRNTSVSIITTNLPNILLDPSAETSYLRLNNVMFYLLFLAKMK